MVKVPADASVIVQLFDQKKELIAKSLGDRFNFNVRPGKYFFQMFNDQDKDGYYTGGNKEARRKAEPLFIYPEPVELKLGWDLEKISIDPGFD